MRVLFKVLAYLIVLGAVGLLGFAIFSDLPPPVRTVSLPVAAR